MVTIFTIGHSTRPITELIEMLRAHGIGLVVDVRTIPGSKRNPQYGKDELDQSLRQGHIEYRHMPGLGGLRRARKDSVNTAWKNASFRGYADYMQTEEFGSSLEVLVETSRKQATAIMCAEAVPWRCHRSLIGDALLVRGIKVVDIVGKGSMKEHLLTPWAAVEGKSITYPGRRRQKTPGRESG